MAEGWIYILINPALQKDLLKIGKTIVSPEDRAKQLSTTSVPTEFHVAYDVKVKDCDKAELVVHNRLSKYRYKKNREFFKISLKNAILIVNKVVDKTDVIFDDLIETEPHTEKFNITSTRNDYKSIKVLDKFLSIVNNHINKILTAKEIKDLIIEKYPGTNRTSLIPSDYCYNLVNKGISFKNHLFEQVEQGKYKVLGENYKYSGFIYWSKQTEPVGEWRDGVIIKHPDDYVKQKTAGDCENTVIKEY